MGDADARAFHLPPAGAALKLPDKFDELGCTGSRARVTA
jgi:hypothetical protein